MATGEDSKVPPATADELYNEAQLEVQQDPSVPMSVHTDAEALPRSSDGGHEVSPAELANAVAGEVAKDVGEEEALEEAFEEGFITRSDLDELSSEEGEEGEEDDEGEDVEVNTGLVLFLDLLQDSVDDDKETEDDPRVHVDPELSHTVVQDLVSAGPWLFMSKYLLTDPRPVPLPQLFAALGFSLPQAVFSNPQITQQDIEMGLQVAMRYVMKTRPRLAYPRTLDEVVDVIDKSRKILVITGAGISTSLGIPDFRSDNGLYAQLEHLGLAEPQEVFDIRVFREDPSIFYSVAAKILPEEGIHSGTPTHKFVRMLDERGKLLRNYTQNIDNIEQFVGINPDRLVQCHGSFGSAHCVTCGYMEPKGDVLFPAIKQGEIPRCPECAARSARGKRKHNEDSDEDENDEPSFGVMKPDITFFGESLPPRFDHLLFDEGDKDACDLVICLGTSLRVSPVSEIVKVVGRQVPQIYISKTPAKHLNFEACFLGGCDDTVELLSQKLGWDMHHTLAKRPGDMPANKYPGGDIDYSDGVFRFCDETDVDTKSEVRLENKTSEDSFESKDHLGNKGDPESGVENKGTLEKEELEHAHESTIGEKTGEEQA